MKLNLERMTIICRCCGNAVYTIWAFEQQLLVGHFVDGEMVQGQIDFSYCAIKHGEFCFGGYSDAELHKTDCKQNEKQ